MPAPPKEVSKLCLHCGSDGKTKACACKQVYFCNAHCQKLAWAKHKDECLANPKNRPKPPEKKSWAVPKPAKELNEYELEEMEKGKEAARKADEEHGIKSVEQLQKEEEEREKTTFEKWPAKNGRSGLKGGFFACQSVGLFQRVQEALIEIAKEEKAGNYGRAVGLMNSDVLNAMLDVSEANHGGKAGLIADGTGNLVEASEADWQHFKSIVVADACLLIERLVRGRSGLRAELAASRRLVELANQLDVKWEPPEEAPDPTTNPDDIVSKPTQPLICAAQRALATVCAQEGAYHQAIEEFGKAVLAAEPVLDLRSIKARAEAWNHQAEKEPEGSAERAFACDVCVADCRAVLAGTDPEEHSAHIHAQMTLSRFLWVGAQMKKEDVATSAAAREAFNIADQVFHNQKSPLGSANNELARHIMRKIATDGLDVGTLNQRRYLTSTAEPTCDSLSGLS